MKDPPSKLVTIRDGTQPLGARVCRIFQLPDGCPAALWRGRLYPLHGDTIDAGGDAFAPSSLPAGPLPIGIGLQPGDGVSTVLVAGDSASRDQVVARLRAAGFSILRDGCWLGDPVDGLVADWFIRVADASSDGLAHALRDLRVAMPGPVAVADTRLRLLGNEIAALRTRFEEMVAQNQVLRLDADAALAAGQEAEAESGRLRALLADQHAALVEAEQVSLPRTSTAPAPRRLTDEISTVIESLLPCVLLLRDSLQVAAGEFRDRAALYRALAELPTDGTLPPQPWKTLQGGTRFRERHVSNGDSNAGRLYARFDPATRRWAVLVGHKVEQDRDIRWLERQG